MARERRAQGRRVATQLWPPECKPEDACQIYGHAANRLGATTFTAA